MKPQYIDIHTHNPLPDTVSPTMAGIHPWDSEKGVSLPHFGECDIIGETGLDYACNINRAAQQKLFEQHLSAAEELHKPVVIHSVKAFEDIYRTLRRYTLQGVLFHGFIGSIQQAELCFEQGWYLSFGTRSLRSSRTLKVIAQTPAHLLFCETDDDTTQSIESIYREIAEIRNTSTEELLKQIETNYKTLINR